MQHNPVSLYEAKTHLSSLVDRAATGEEIIIAKNGTPRAKLIGLRPIGTAPRQPAGALKVTAIAADFDAVNRDTVALGAFKQTSSKFHRVNVALSRPRSRSAYETGLALVVFRPCFLSQLWRLACVVW